MSYTNAQAFLKNDTCFLADTSSCVYQLAAHSVLVDMMMGPTNPFAVAYHNCIRELQSHLLLGLKLHYGDKGGACYHMALRIIYWLMQQFFYFLSQRKFSQNPLLPDFDSLLWHTHTKNLDGFVEKLPASWMELVKPSNLGTSNSGSKKTKGKNNMLAGADTMVTNMSCLEPYPKEALGGKQLHSLE